MSEAIKAEGTVRAVSGKGNSFQLEGDDKWYGVFNAADLTATSGDFVSFTYAQKGRWNNVKGKVTGSGGSGSAAPSSGGKAAPRVTGGRTFPVRGTAPERTINRQNALTNAVNLCKDHGSTPEEVIEVARKFEAYTCGDLDLAEALTELDEALAKMED